MDYSANENVPNSKLFYLCPKEHWIERRQSLKSMKYHLKKTHYISEEECEEHLLNLQALTKEEIIKNMTHYLCPEESCLFQRVSMNKVVNHYMGVHYSTNNIPIDYIEPFSKDQIRLARKKKYSLNREKRLLAQSQIKQLPKKVNIV